MRFSAVNYQQDITVKLTPCSIPWIAPTIAVITYYTMVCLVPKQQPLINLPLLYCVFTLFLIVFLYILDTIIHNYTSGFYSTNNFNFTVDTGSSL